MFDSIFQESISATSMLLMLLAAVVSGFLSSLILSFIFRSTKRFYVTNAILIATIAAIVAFVNGDNVGLGAGVAIGGAFGLTRFRSAQGTADEMGAIVINAAAGIAFGMGYLTYGFIISLGLSLVMLLFTKLNLFERKNLELEKLVNEISIDINPFTEEININIRKYIEELVELINQISGNLQELKDLMNSQENTETKIANYYSNNTSTSFLDIIQNTNYIFTNYYKNESIYNEIQEMLNKVDVSEFESKINDISSEFNIFFEHEQNDNIKNNLNNLRNKIISINQNIKDEFEKKIITEENGYFIPNIDIVNINNKFIEIKNDLINAHSNLNNLDIDSIDKIFDQIMNDFKENITNILIFLEDEKNNKFPLEEDILNDNFFSSKEKQKIKNEIEELNNNIINEIKDTYNTYINNIQQEVEKLLKNKNELNSFIFEINALCSIDSLQELSKSFDRKNSLTRAAK